MPKAEANIEGAGHLLSPPLFVTAFSKVGKRHEALLEPNLPSPDWFSGELQLRVSAPSGEFVDADVDISSPADDGYMTCLRLLGPSRGWAPRLAKLPTTSAELEVWASKTDSIEVSTGPVLAIAEAGSTHGPSDAGSTQIKQLTRFYAVVRNADGSSIHVANSGRIYLDVNSSSERAELLPRALLDTGMPGAFWGFVEHSNAPAAQLSAERLLNSLIGEGKEAASLIWVVAATHALLSVRGFLPKYGDYVGKLLEKSPSPDTAILRALLGMARLAGGGSDRDTVKADVRRAIESLASERPLFGETVRWLDAKFSVLRELMLRDFPNDSKLDQQLIAISDWLATSYGGGQVAAYSGEPPFGIKDGWHDALAAQKKTLES